MFKKRTRPLFSVIISCYKSDKYLDNILKSIAKQGLHKDEIEVIISDDHSYEIDVAYDEYKNIMDDRLYKDILDKYNKKLNIKKIVSDHNWGYPAHTREQGVSIATGEWITFADHDDSFDPKIFKKVKAYININNPKYCITTGIVTIDAYNKGTTYYYSNLIDNHFTHGQFYNLDNLWKAFDIHYDYKNFKTLEDFYIIQTIHMLELYANITIDKLHAPGYLYKLHSDQTSSRFNLYNADNKGERSYICYCRCLFLIYLQYYIKYHYTNFLDFADKTVYALCIMYHFYQMLLYYKDRFKIEISDNLLFESKKIIDLMKKYIVCSTVSELVDICTNEAYNNAQEEIYNIYGNFIQIQNFREWVEYIDNVEVPDDYEKEYFSQFEMEGLL